VSQLIPSPVTPAEQARGGIHYPAKNKTPCPAQRPTPAGKPSGLLHTPAQAFIRQLAVFLAAALVVRHVVFITTKRTGYFPAKQLYMQPAKPAAAPVANLG
jgi:hypothetical protein